MRKSERRKLRLKTRLFLQVAVILAVCFAVIMLLNSRYMENAYLWYEKRKVAKMVDTIESIPNIEITYYTELPSFEQKNSLSIELYNAYDELIYESAAKIDLSSKKMDVISREASEDGNNYYLVLREEDSELHYNVYGRVLKNGFLIEVITLVSPIAQSEMAARTFTALLSVIGLIFSLIVVLLFAGRFTKPLEELNIITGEMANLNFKHKCKTDRNDEIGELANNINHLSNSLDSALTQLEKQNKELLSDIDKERKLDIIRKEFISSVSHELKTPIAIIKGYAEGLLALEKDELKTAKEYSDIIVSEADRMNELVHTLLEISLYESGGYVLKEIVFPIGKVIAEHISVIRPFFAEKGIKIESTVPEDLMVKGDAERLFTVINNFLQNAASHTSGEKRITCRYEDRGNFARIIVFNTGPNIMEEDADKLFLNFYRANKAHTREEGRFGLGLSIVKAIMEVHGMDYGFNNTKDGVEFWFEVRKADINNENKG